jgi:hypothetical protein
LDAVRCQFADACGYRQEFHRFGSVVLACLRHERRLDASLVEPYNPSIN